jgi:hypothetical protein
MIAGRRLVVPPEFVVLLQQQVSSECRVPPSFPVNLARPASTDIRDRAWASMTGD